MNFTDRDFVLRVVALDMRGYGDTEKPQYQYAYRIDNMTEDIRCLVRQLGKSNRR